MYPRQARAQTEPLTHETGHEAQSLVLVVLEGPDRDRELETFAPLVRIGRAEDNDVVLNDAAVSGFHCELTLAGGRARVRDSGSRNGIFLNGARIYDGELADGSILSLGSTHLRCRLHGVAPETSAAPLRFGAIVSHSPLVHEALRLLESAARSEVSVLLTGPTGTGKSAAADFLHRSSDRSRGPFVTVDCGAITPTLLESELFGHAGGAFTGASTDRPGAFEAASGGTLFLDEIGDLPLELQPVLLRALETQRVRRLGSNDDRHVDVRVVAATNCDLRGWLDDGRFRADLFYRLAVLEVDFPALAERPEDVPLIVRELTDQIVLGRTDDEALAVAAQLTAPSTVAALQEYAWPGNVRELRNYIHRCFALGELVPVEEMARERS